MYDHQIFSPRWVVVSAKNNWFPLGGLVRKKTRALPAVFRSHKSVSESDFQVYNFSPNRFPSGSAEPGWFAFSQNCICFGSVSLFKLW